MRPRSVLLVHGILGQRHLYWNIFRRRLQADGFRVHEVILPYALLGDLRIAARMLADKVEATLRGDGVDKVSLVCHSAGGLVARYYLKYLRGHRLVETLVTMGTPHKGTIFAHAFPVPFLEVARQTRPGSQFIQELAGGAIEGVHHVNIWGPLDAVVIPSQSALIDGAQNVRLPWATHWGFLWRQDVHDAVRQALDPQYAVTRQSSIDAVPAPDEEQRPGA